MVDYGHTSEIQAFLTIGKTVDTANRRFLSLTEYIVVLHAR